MQFKSVFVITKVKYFVLKCGLTVPSSFQVVMKHAGELFEVMLPDGHVIEFPNREELDVITYIRIKGDINLTSFKLK